MNTVVAERCEKGEIVPDCERVIQKSKETFEPVYKTTYGTLAAEAGQSECTAQVNGLAAAAKEKVK